MPKLRIATSKTHTQPHFASHTQSSLMKIRTPMKLKKLSSITDVNESKSQKSIIPKLNGIYKKRSSITKQSKSMQMLVMILKQQIDRRGSVFLPSELTGTTCQLDNSLVSFQSDLMKDISQDFKKCIGSPAKLTLRSEQTKVINKFESFYAEDVHNSQDETNCVGKDNLNDIHSSEDRAIVDVTHKLQLHLNNEKEIADLHCEVEDLHSRTESGEKPKDFPNKDCTETQLHPQDINATMNRKRTRKTWVFRKAETQNEHVNIDYANYIDLQNSKVTKHIDTVVNSDATIRKRSTLQKNFTSNQRAWRPPGVSKNWITKSTMSLQPMISQKSQSIEKSTVSAKSKHLSTECIKSCNSESTSTLENQSKMLMKENRDPRTNHMTTICEHLDEVKQRQRLQSRGTLPKKTQSKTKIGSKILDKCNDTNPILMKSNFRHCQTRSITPKESSNNIEQHHIESDLYNKSKTLEVIHTLRKIIDNIKENNNVEENVKKHDDFDHEKNNNMTQTLPNSDISQNNEPHIFVKDTCLDELNRSSQRSISTQTTLDFSSYHEIDAEKDRDLTEILNLTRIVATQTLPSCNRNVVEVGCNTSDIICNDVEVSCDLIGLTDLKTEVEAIMIEDKSLNVHTKSSVKYIEVNVKNEDANKNKELLLSESKKMLNTEMNLKLEKCDSMEMPIKLTNNAIEETEKIMHEKIYRISSRPLFKNFDDKTNINIDKKQKSIKCSSNHNVSNTSINNLFSETSQPSICNYDASCSSEEIVECLESDVQYTDTVTSESKDIPSDVIAAFELAAKHARNLHEAVVIYYENLISRESEKKNKEKIEDYEKFHDEQNCFDKYEFSISREDEDKIRSECDAICHFVYNGDFSGFSTCSSCCSSSDQICGSEFPKISSKDDYFEIERREENTILSKNEQARSILNKRSDLEDIKSLLQLLVHRTQEEDALELLKLEKSDESFEMKGIKNEKMLALPTAIKKKNFPYIVQNSASFYLLHRLYCSVLVFAIFIPMRLDKIIFL